MKPDKQRQLIERFPNIFRECGKPPSESCMAFGLEIGDGWFDLVSKLCEDLEREAPDTYAVQVKEKFGGLCFYVAEATDQAHSLIEKAEDDSFTICEVCGLPGTPGTPTGGGWIRTLCENHKAEQAGRDK